MVRLNKEEKINRQIAVIFSLKNPNLIATELTSYREKEKKTSKFNPLYSLGSPAFVFCSFIFSLLF